MARSFQASERQANISYPAGLLNETDLHHRVVEYIRQFHPNAIIVPGPVGGAPGIVGQAPRCLQEGLQGPPPHLILSNLHVHYYGFEIELETPKGNRTVSENQRRQLLNYPENGYKTMISNDYDLILKEIEDYMRGTRVRCGTCMQTSV